ncbi:reverse transcriptase [Cinnamomum micranthum f. kanehirae]|uniref:Reverse transcriptase n=1 Tax=Cinnamomum micranthum f. kanehirae TaxID=337451 RepID=A0A3S3R607_9MAGN|nr:reverse transcriptase [Cinnamomum micranthum f. kanehirae]
MTCCSTRAPFLRVTSFHYLEVTKRLGLKVKQDKGWSKAVNAEATPIHGVVRCADIAIGDCRPLPIPERSLAPDEKDAKSRYLWARGDPAQLTPHLRASWCAGEEWGWVMEDKCQRAFEDLKRAVTEELVLRLPDYSVPFEVHTEASDYAIGRVLVQEGHPVADESWKLNETERRGPRERDDSSSALPEDMEALLAFGLDLWSRLVATSDFAT